MSDSKAMKYDNGFTPQNRLHWSVTFTMRDAVYSLFIVIAHVPVVGKVIADAVGDDAQADVFLVRSIGVHNAVDSIVQGAVATHDDDGMVAVVGQNAGQTFHRAEPFGLYVVISHVPAVHVFLDFFPPFLHFACAGFGVVYHPPFFG